MEERRTLSLWRSSCIDFRVNTNGIEGNDDGKGNADDNEWTIITITINIISNDKDVYELNAPRNV